jgi:CHAD domain-containing protein
VEYVHQLRVATRRATEAIRLFEPYLPSDLAERTRKLLQSLRRAANDARDWDVLATRIARIPADDSTEGIAVVRSRVESLRQEAQQPINRAYRELDASRFADCSTELANSVRLPPKQRKKHSLRFDRQARKSLKHVVRRFLTAWPVDLADDRTLHTFRIHAKRLRYAMEILAAAFDDAFRRISYSRVCELQDYLGAINDHATAQKRLATLRDASMNEAGQRYLDDLLAGEVSALTESRTRFYRWWTPKRGAKLRVALMRYCVRHRRE